MKSTFTLLFYVNRSKEKNGSVPVMGRITIRGTVAQFSCKLQVPTHLWDAKAHRAQGRGATAREVNLVLEEIRTRIYRHYRQLSDLDPGVTADRVRNAFLGIGEGPGTLLELFDRERTEFHKRVGHDRAASSYRCLSVVRRHLADFIRLHYHREDLALRELTEEFIRSFCTYLCCDLHLTSTTAWAYCTPLKRVVARAHQDGRIGSNPFARFHVSPNVKKREFLTEAELLTLMRHPLKDPVAALTRDLFVFGCLTGISFIDIKQLETSQVVELDGSQWICAVRQKTKTPYYIRLLDIPLAIIRRHGSQAKEGSLFDVPAYWKVSEQLKRIARECGFHKHLTFHVSRHTFATLALSKGMPIESVSRILGHTKITTTQIYAKITTSKLDRDLALFSERLGSSFKPG